jgi:surface antigen
VASTLAGDLRTAQHGRAARRRAVGLVLSVLAGLASVPVLAVGPAAAGEGMTTLCDRADYGCVADTGYHGQSVWGANYGVVGHNCTSYVSYLLAEQGVAQPWRPMGNANRWDDNGAGHVVVDDIPAPGAVAQWEGGTRYAPGSSGHVAFVESVSATGIELTDDNHSGGTRRVQIERGSPYWPSHFVHIHDTPPPPVPVLFQDTIRMNRRIGTQLHTSLRRLGQLLQEALVGIAG